MKNYTQIGSHWLQNYDMVRNQIVFSGFLSFGNTVTRLADKIYSFYTYFTFDHCTR